MSLTREMAAYDEMRRSLEADRFGEWVIVHDELLAGAYADFESAAEDAVRRFGRGPYLIRQVGEGPVTLPASVRYGPVHGQGRLRLRPPAPPDEDRGGA